MNRFAFLLLVSVSLWANQVMPQEPAGTVRRGHSLDSHILGRAVPYTVYLPSQYEDSDRPFPIVFMLHGSGGNEKGLLERQHLNLIADNLIASGKISPMILVMPDGASTRYLNNHDNSLRYQDFFFSEFVPQIESEYRVESNKTNRAILGVSMGGYGSLIYALRFPGMFSASVSIGAPICEDEIVLGLSQEQWNKSDRGPVYGLDLAGQDRFTDHYRSNDPCFMVQNIDPELISTAGIYLACGDDDFRNDGNAALHALMRRLSISHEYRVKDGGHTDVYFQVALADGLIYISEKFASP